MKIKIIGDMYGILLDLKIKWEKDTEGVSFSAFVDNEIENLKNQAMEWLADDEREAKQSI